MDKKNGNLYITIIFGILCGFMLIVLLCTSCANKTDKNTTQNFGTKYRVVTVLSGGEQVWKFKGSVGVEVDGDTTIITTNAGKKHIFVNADVIIRESDKMTEDKKYENSKESEDKKYENSKESGVEESSRAKKEISTTSESESNTISEVSHTSTYQTSTIQQSSMNSTSSQVSH